MEQFESIEKSYLKIRNAMQVELARRFYGFQDEDKIIEWIDEYSSAFSEIISKNPGLISRYAINRDEVMNEIEKVLYVEKINQ